MGMGAVPHASGARPPSPLRDPSAFDVAAHPGGTQRAVDGVVASSPTGRAHTHGPYGGQRAGGHLLPAGVACRHGGRAPDPGRPPQTARHCGTGPDPGGAHLNTRIGVVVITRNRRRELLRTLRALETLPESPPIVVVDNASCDGTAEAVARAHPEVRLIRSRTYLGAVGRNVGVEALPTPYVAFCDDDSWWEPGSLARATELLDAHPPLGAVTARLLVEPSGQEDPLLPELRHSPLPRPDWLPGPALLGILAGASVLRVRAFQEVGGFSERLWLGGEEELLALDLARFGWWMCWDEQMVAHHQASQVRDPRQ